MKNMNSGACGWRHSVMG